MQQRRTSPSKIWLCAILVGAVAVGIGLVLNHFVQAGFVQVYSLPVSNWRLGRTPILLSITDLGMTGTEVLGETVYLGPVAVDVLNRRGREGRLAALDQRWADLTHANLRGADLRGVNLAGADL